MLRMQIGTLEASLTNKTQEVEEGISGIEGRIEEVATSVKENVKSKILLAQNIQEIWKSMDRPSLRIIGIQEIEDTHIKSTENIFSKIRKKSLT